MLRLFVPGAQSEPGRVRITGSELRHLRTLRLEAGAPLAVFDDQGCEHEVVIERMAAREAWATILATRRPLRESPLDLVVAPALLKGAKMDLVVEKLTEVGVARIAPVITRYTIGRGPHIDRWRRIAVAAAKQSARTRVPSVDAPVPLGELLRAPWPGLRLVAWEGEHVQGLADVPANTTALVMVIGPEGGLAPEEVAEARALGFTTVRLAPRLLRAETAAIVAAALCQHRWGDG